ARSIDSCAPSQRCPPPTPSRSPPSARRTTSRSSALPACCRRSSLRRVSTTTATIASIVAGRQRTDSPGGVIASTNPAQLDDVVADAFLGDAQTFVDACAAAREAQREWAKVPAPVRGRAIHQIGRLVEANKEALAR